jgi:hypothetical protein
MLTLFGRTIISLLALHLGAGLVHAGENNDAPRSHAVATASARIIVLCNVSTRPGPDCPTPSLSATSTSLVSATATSSPAKANELTAPPVVTLNFE